MILRAVEDADLIRKARRGDVEAYNLLISRWERRVYNYLLRIVANREDALDLFSSANPRWLSAARCTLSADQRETVIP